MQSSSEYNLHGYSRSSTPLKINEPKDNDPLSAIKDSYEIQMIEMKREMKKNMEEAEQKHLAQLKEIQNRVITVERTQPPPPPRTFPAKPIWQRRNPSHEQRPPHQLEAANIVKTYTPFCRTCEDLHEDFLLLCMLYSRAWFSRGLWS